MWNQKIFDNTVKGYPWDFIWNYTDDPGINERLRSLLVFDDLGFENFVLLDLAQKDSPGLLLYLQGDRIYDLKLSIAQYIEKTIEYAGLYLWQRYFAPDYVVHPLDLEDRCHEIAQKLSPKSPSLQELSSLRRIPRTPDFKAKFASRWAGLRRVWIWN